MSDAQGRRAYQDLGQTIRPSVVYPETTYDVLPVGTYQVRLDMRLGWVLDKVSNLQPPGKVYGNLNRLASRYLQTFEERDAGTGVLLAGTKGAGKTMLAKVVSAMAREKGISTVLCTAHIEDFDGFMAFIQSLDPCVLLFEEIDKVYDADETKHLLTMWDGVYTSKKLSILTCNDVYRLDSHVLNRPGRMFYYKNFERVDMETVSEYLQENYRGPHDRSELKGALDGFANLTFDMLQAIIEEMNRYGETIEQVMQHLNVRPTDRGISYTVQEFIPVNKKKAVENSGEKNWETALQDLSGDYYDIFNGRIWVMGIHFNTRQDFKGTIEGGVRIYENKNGDVVKLSPVSSYRSSDLF